jgi:hypothetical protein
MVVLSEKSKFKKKSKIRKQKYLYSIPTASLFGKLAFKWLSPLASRRKSKCAHVIIIVYHAHPAVQIKQGRGERGGQQAVPLCSCDWPAAGRAAIREHVRACAMVSAHNREKTLHRDERPLLGYGKPTNL